MSLRVAVSMDSQDQLVKLVFGKVKLDHVEFFHQFIEQICLITILRINVPWVQCGVISSVPFVVCAMHACLSMC
jgi:hypothetical protein